MAAEATLWVEITPTTKGIKGKVEREFGQGFSAVESRGKGLWGRIGDGVKGLAATVTGVLGAAFTKAAVGGFARLLNIEDAQAKLRGLGNDAASVEKIMANASASVEGTAFSLDAAATAAAGAVAAGIKPGQELERVLSSVANAAAATGSGMDDMGAIFNKVASSAGGAITTEIQQVADRGLPIWQSLADVMGVTTAEAKKLSSEGKISFDIFEQAVSSAAGTVADELGGTVRGSFDNFMNSFSRVGAAFLESSFPLIAPVLQTLRAAVLGLVEPAGVLGEKFAGALASVGDVFSGMAEGAAGLAPVLGPLAGAFLALGAGALPGLLGGLPLVGPMLAKLAGPLGMLGGPIGLIVGAFAGLVAVSPELREALGGLVGGVFGALTDVFAQLQPVIAQLVPLIVSLAQTLGGVLADVISAIVPVIVELVGLFAGLLAQALPPLITIVSQLAYALGKVLTVIAPIVEAVLTALMPVIGELVPVVGMLLEAFLPVVSILLDALMPILDMVIGLVVMLAEAFAPLIGDILPLLMTIFTKSVVPILGVAAEALYNLFAAIGPIVDAIATALMPIIEALMGVLGGLINFLVGVFTGDWERAWGGIKDFFGGIWNTIVSIVEGAVNLVIGLINGLITGLNGITEKVGIPAIPLIGYVDWSVAKLAAGGYVSSGGGGVLAQVGEGRYDEVVQPVGGPKFETFVDSLAARLGAGGGESEPIELSDQTLQRLARLAADAFVAALRAESRKAVA